MNKLKEVTLKKGYIEKLTTKDRFGSYDSKENQAEVIMTFEGENIDIEKAKEIVRSHALDLMDQDPKWIKEKQSNEK